MRILISLSIAAWLAAFSFVPDAVAARIHLRTGTIQDEKPHPSRQDRHFLAPLLPGMTEEAEQEVLQPPPKEPEPVLHYDAVPPRTRPKRTPEQLSVTTAEV